MPQFSIIIPVFNAAATLEQTLSSVAKQTFAEYEVVLVDDGSTDASAQIIASETKEWPNIRVITQENRGLGTARNVAAKTATGHWLVFLDADDFWAADKLAILNQAILRNPEIELLYHSVFEKYPNGSMRKRAFWEVENVTDFAEKGNPFVPSAMAIKRDLFLQAGGFIEDRNQVEDLLLWFKLLASEIKAKAIHRPLTVYRVGIGVTGNLQEHLLKVENALSEARALKLISEDQLSTFLQRKNYEAARQLHKLGKFAEALGYYHKCSGLTFKQRLLQMLSAWHISA